MSNRFVVAAVAAGCIAAAGAGGYLATRQNVTPAPISAATPAAAPAAAAPVQETEAVVPSAPAPVKETAKPGPAPAKSKPPAARRADPAPRASSSRVARADSPAQPPSLDRPWPSSAQQPLPAPPQDPQHPAGTLVPSDGSSLPPTHDAQEPAPAPEKTFEELVVPADSVVGLQTETTISSERSRVEDPVDARVTRDVRVGDRVAIPAGSRALGSVTVVDRGGKFRERARLGVRFHTIVLADGTRLSINTDTLYREGDAPGAEASKKIGGGAAVGAILGAIIGGAKGAAIGAAVGGIGGLVYDRATRNNGPGW